MTDFEFTLELVEVIEDIDDAETLYAAFNDGMMCTSCGVTRIDFDREGPSLADAIRSAISDVERCGFHVSRVTTEEASLVEEINASLAGTAAH